MRNLQDRDIRDPQVAQRLPDLRDFGRGTQLQLVFGRRHRGVLLEKLAREVGHLELLLDIDAGALQRGDHPALLALDRDLALRVALVDDDLQVEFVGRDLLLGTSVDLDIAGEGLLHLGSRGQQGKERRHRDNPSFHALFHGFSVLRGFKEYSFADKTARGGGYCTPRGAFHPPSEAFHRKRDRTGRHPAVSAVRASRHSRRGAYGGTCRPAAPPRRGRPRSSAPGRGPAWPDCSSHRRSARARRAG